MDLPEQSHEYNIIGSIVKVLYMYDDVLLMTLCMYATTQRLLDDELAAYQSKSKENRSIDYDSTAAVLLLDQYCHCPVHELVSGYHGYWWFPYIDIIR